MIRNVHERALDAPPTDVGALINGLASEHDRLWPNDRWPPMRLDRPLGLGASGGHGFIRYSVSDYQPGRRARFRFDPPTGLAGHHLFEVASCQGRTTLRHTLDAAPRGRMRIGWPLIVRWLHDTTVRANGAARAHSSTHRSARDLVRPNVLVAQCDSGLRRVMSAV
jgi:hypothetical protein